MNSHQLNIESGRFQNIARQNRLCTLCNCQDIEDELHFILKCPFLYKCKEQVFEAVLFS